MRKVILVMGLILLGNISQISAAERTCGIGYGYNYDRDAGGYKMGYGYGCGYGPRVPVTAPQKIGDNDNYGVQGDSTYTMPDEVVMRSGEVRALTQTTVTCGDATYDDIPTYENDKEGESLALALGDSVRIESDYLVMVSCQQKLSTSYNPWAY